jgi:hypothetical protein
MDSRDPLRGIRLKVQRAKDQIEFLNKEVSAFLGNTSYLPALSYHGDTQSFSVRMHITAECPTMWSILAGEVLHNLRSALDHAVYELVILNTGTPPPSKSRSRNQFPIFVDAAEFDRNPQMLVGVSDRRQVAVGTTKKTAATIWPM